MRIGASIGAIALAQRPPSSAVSGYDVILLAGQSNMVGYGLPLDPALDTTDSRILQYGYDTQTVSLASDPLRHPDTSNQTQQSVGLGMSFARAYLATLPQNRAVLLVPVARGNTGFGSGVWTAGGLGDTTAIARVNAAMTQVKPGAANASGNRLAAILWHQGENDWQMTEGQYASNLDALIARWRAGITGASASTPFVCGGTTNMINGGGYTGVSPALMHTPDRVAYTAFAPSAGLTGGTNDIHFNAADIRTMGTRYYTAYQQALLNAGVVPAAPGAISNLVATAGDTLVNLTWTSPVPGTAPITDYVVQYKTSAASTWSTFADGTSASTAAAVTGLSNGTSYDFRVSGVNSVGQGPTSNVASATPVAATPSVAETAATRHWLFGTDNPTHADMKSGELMVPAGASPTIQTSYVQTANGSATVGNGLGAATSTDAAAMTACAVINASTAAGIQFGTMHLSPNTGVGVFTNGPIVGFWANGQDFTQTISPTPVGRWVFVAFSMNNTSRLYFVGDATAPVVSAGTRTWTPNGLPFALGAVNFLSDSFAAGSRFAELILFNKALTQAEIQAVYGRSVSRLAARGITLS